MVLSILAVCPGAAKALGARHQGALHSVSVPVHSLRINLLAAGLLRAYRGTHRRRPRSKAACWPAGLQRQNFVLCTR